VQPRRISGIGVADMMARPTVDDLSPADAEGRMLTTRISLFQPNICDETEPLNLRAP